MFRPYWKLTYKEKFYRTIYGSIFVYPASYFFLVMSEKRLDQVGIGFYGAMGIMVLLGLVQLGWNYYQWKKSE